ncbi:MAG: twin-arginine translocase TatA/TatE family subunit [Actinomycetota bacterium]|nr:twin-arginine translocase TatA/TatE family subunit [Actinomycetota bacterium]
MGSVGTAELIIILVVLLALFGGKKIPGIARSLGRSLNEFKAGLRDVPSTSDEKSSSESEE